MRSCGWLITHACQEACEITTLKEVQGISIVATSSHKQAIMAEKVDVNALGES